MDLIETSELQAFLRCVEAQSLSRAAFELSVPRATLSRRLARLEDRLGVRLITRSTRSIALTDAGEVFYANARLALDAVQRAEESVRQRDDAVAGSLRVSTLPLSLPSFHMLLCRFAERHPGVDLQVHFSTEMVNLLQAEYHLALRSSRDLAPGLVGRTLARAPTIAVASPRYLERAGVPTRVEELQDHRCLVGFERGELPEMHWPLRSGGRVAVKGSFSSNDLQVLARGAREGLGIALLPAVRELVGHGDLVQVLPDELGLEAKIVAVYPEKEFLPPQVRAFIDALVEWAPEAFGNEVVTLPRA